MPTSKQRKAELQERRERVAALMALQYTPSRIEREVADEFDCSPRSVRRDITEVLNALAEQGEKDRPLRRHQMRETLRAFMRSAASDRKWLAAARFADLLMKLDGLYDLSIQVEHSGEVTIDQMTSDERRGLISSLLAKYADKPVPTNGHATH